MGDWQTITLNNSGMLHIQMWNMTPRELKGTEEPTSHHFVLNHKLVWGADLPMINSCDNPDRCIGCAGLKICLPLKPGFGAEVGIPGCSDTQWP